jgi:hypothetical protein
MLTNSETRLSATGSGCCTSMSWVVTLGIGSAWTSTVTIPEPGQTDPGWHTAQGLIPETVPWDEYPGEHTHAFCEVESAGDVLSVGQRLAIPDLHQNPSIQGAHVSP